MRIERVEAILMSCPLPEPLRLPFWGGVRTILKRDAMLVRVTTDTGLRGYAPGPAHERARAEIEGSIAPFLRGRDPASFREWRFDGDPELKKTYHAVEIAVLDLVARCEGCPLSELVGGRKRDRIKLYGSAGMYMAPEKYAEEAAAIAAQGFPAYKMRPGLGPDEDLRTVRLMRDAVGPNVGLMVDAHTWWRMGDRSYSPDVIAALARELSDARPTWLEEPLPPDDHAAYRALRATGSVPIASGEHEQNLEGFFDLIDTRAVDYVQMDVLCQGGFEMAQRIFERVEERGLRFAFHSWGTALEVLAAAHVGVCWPESVVEWLECPVHSAPGRAGMYPFELADSILRDPLPIEGGYLVVPDRPGLGIEIDEAVIDRYPFIPGPWSFFELDSPRETIAVTGDHSVKWVEPTPA
jgi:L-alanine-DL-glutamate epimerase-like enolase superfamily enzyme